MKDEKDPSPGAGSGEARPIGEVWRRGVLGKQAESCSGFL